MMFKALLACVVGLWAASVIAQTDTATVLGTVTDTQQAALPGATVTARNVATGIARTGVTEQEGRYRIAAVPPGVYEVSAELSGFSRALRPDVRLTLGSEAVLNFELGVAAVAETVTVSADAPVVETTTSAVSETIGRQSIDLLPLAGRDFTSLLRLVPGAVANNTTYGFAGSRGRSNTWNQANVNPAIRLVHFLGQVSVIGLQQTVWFTGSQDLAISGNGATLDGTNAGGPAFRATGGGDLGVFRLTVRNSPAEGIAIEVPQFRTGTIHVLLTQVDIIDNDGHGVLVDDQDDPSTAIIERDSAASVDVSLVNTRFIRNGYSVIDRDGLRVNEGADGDLIITIFHSLAQDNGADGIEVDERGAGDVRVNMLGSHVIGNGKFDPADLDDGFDIDENDDGSIVGTVFASSANDNFEEGFDFNENHAGDLRVDMRQVTANGNGEEGIDYEEGDDFVGGGDLVTTMVQVTANGNGAIGGDAGLKIREKGDGHLDATLTNVEASNNLIGGISIREDAVGSLVSSITRATTLTNNGNGIDFDENRTNSSDPSGDLTATVTRSSSSNNAGFGVRADQQAPPGVGTLLLTRVALNENTLGATTGSNVVVTTIP